MTDRFPIPTGCYIKPSGAIASYPSIQVLPDPALSGNETRFERAAIYVSPAEFERRLALAQLSRPM